MSYSGRMRDDGLCDSPAVSLSPGQLLGTVCVKGGAACPLFGDRSIAQAVLDRIRADPAATIRLVSDADRIPHYTALDSQVYDDIEHDTVLNRKRDLDVLQRLGLVPGDTRRARYLFELLLARIESTVGICAYDTDGWDGCQYAHTGAYERVRKTGWSGIGSIRSSDDKRSSRCSSADRIRTDKVLHIRPHHLMCMSCWLGTCIVDTRPGDGICLDTSRGRPEDTLDELWKRIKTDRDVEIRLVEGNCEACHCCDGFDASSTRCVHPGGLLRDYKKDLDVFQKLGLLPGDTMNARELLLRIFERIESTREVCAYGDGEVTSREWSICGDPDGREDYRLAREVIPKLLEIS